MRIAYASILTRVRAGEVSRHPAADLSSVRPDACHLIVWPRCRNRMFVRHVNGHSACAGGDYQDQFTAVQGSPGMRWRPAAWSARCCWLLTLILAALQWSHLAA